MVKHVSINADDERHQNCVKCNGEKISTEILLCNKEGCDNICHIACEASPDFENIYPTIDHWYCSNECNISKVPRVSVETQPQSWLVAQERYNLQISQLTEALEQAMAFLTHSENECAKLKSQLCERDAKIKQLRDRMASASLLLQGPDSEKNVRSTMTSSADYANVIQPGLVEISGKADQLLSTFNTSWRNVQRHSNVNGASLPHSKTNDSVNAFSSPDSSYTLSTAGCSNATLVARERVRLRRSSNQTSSATHAARDERELIRLKLARQQIDELNKFKGEQMDWLAFEEEVYATWDAGEYNDYEMVKKLRRAIEGDAKDYVRLALNAPEANPEHVMETLRRKYYHPNVAVTKAFREVMSIEPVRNKVRKPLESLLTATENYIHVCNLVKIQQQLYARVNGEVEAKLPCDLRADWNKLIRKSSTTNGDAFTGNWIDFWKFLRENVQDMPLADDISTKSSTGKAHVLHVATKLRSGHSENKRARASCLFDKCDKRSIHRCKAFWKLPYHERLKFIESHNICKRCVNSSQHNASQCPQTKLKCKISNCAERTRHSTILHPPAESSCNQSQHEEAFTSYQMLPVLVHDANGSPVRTLAMLDDGSDSTIMSQELADRLQLPSETFDLEVDWCAEGIKARNKASSRFDCHISSITDPLTKYNMDGVVTIKNLKLPMQEQQPTKLKKSFPFLSDVPIPEYSSERPQILIGLEQKHLTTPLKVVRLNNCPVVAELTSLGWTVSGKIKPKSYAECVSSTSLVISSNHDHLPGDSGSLKTFNKPTRRLRKQHQQPPSSQRK